MKQDKVEMMKRFIKSNNRTIKGFSDELGIAESTFYRKTAKEDGGFTIEEAQRIAKILALTKEEAFALFF